MPWKVQSPGRGWLRSPGGWPALVGAAVVLGACGGATSSTDAGTVTMTRTVSGLELLNAISCPTADWCEAVGATTHNGEGAVVTISQGRPGALHLIAGTKALTAVSCSSESSCEAAGVGGGHGVVVAIEHESPSSTQAVSGMSTFSALSCVGTSCVGGGRSLSVGAIASGPAAVLTVSGTTSVNGIDCWQPTTCEAVASTSNGKYNDVLVSMVGNRLSPLRFVPPRTSTFSGISCSGSVRCVAVGRGTAKVDNRLVPGAVVVDVESGAPQPLHHLPGSSTTVLEAVDCASSTVCEAVGNAESQGGGGAARGLFVAIDDGKPEHPKSISGSASVLLSGISCPTTALCQAVGEDQTAKKAEVVTLATGG